MKQLKNVSILYNIYIILFLYRMNIKQIPFVKYAVIFYFTLVIIEVYVIITCIFLFYYVFTHIIANLYIETLSNS